MMMMMMMMMDGDDDYDCIIGKFNHLCIYITLLLLK